MFRSDGELDALPDWLEDELQKAINRPRYRALFEGFNEELEALIEEINMHFKKIFCSYVEKDHNIAVYVMLAQPQVGNIVTSEGVDTSVSIKTTIKELVRKYHGIFKEETNNGEIYFTIIFADLES